MRYFFRLKKSSEIRSSSGEKKSRLRSMQIVKESQSRPRDNPPAGLSPLNPSFLIKKEQKISFLTGVKNFS